MINLPEWFVEQKFTENEKYAISTGAEVSTLKETLKAKQIYWTTKHGTIVKWIPKSIVEGTYKAKNVDGEYAMTKDGRKILIIEHGESICKGVDGRKYITSFLKFI